MDPKTDELRAAHDVLAEFYAERLAGHLESAHADRAVLGVFCDLVREAGPAARSRMSAAGPGGSSRSSRRAGSNRAAWTCRPT